MKINNNLKKNINNSVVRIIAEDIDINWNLPYTIETPSKGQGTGFFIDTEGYILTCAHVVNGSKNLYIEIPSNGSEKYKCSIISICPYFDIALIKCDTYKSKDYLELSDSNKLNVGMAVIVIGYPASYTISSSNANNLKFTVGIIKGQQQGMIETDSAINPGNSGGPLLCENKVIGINSMKLVGESLESIGYAVPINNYKIIKDCIKNKIIYRPNLLFEYNNTNKNIVKGLTNGSVDNGVIISKILKNSPFMETNIKKDTIITKINNMKIDNYGIIEDYKWLDTSININILLNNYKNDEVIKIHYYNNKKEETCTIKLTPYIPPVRMMFSVFEKIPYMIIGGMIFMNFSVNHFLNMDKNDINKICMINNNLKSEKELLILSYVFPNTKVNILNNIKKDDFITKVNEINVHNVKQLKKALRKPIIINNNEYFKFEEKNGKSVIMSVKDIIEEDLIFSSIYKYPLSEFHNK